MRPILGLAGLVAILIFVEHAYWLIPVWVVIAEAYAIWLDRKAKQTQHKAIQSSKDVKCGVKDLQKHNTEESAWIAIDQSVYDVTEYINKHPGGREFLLLHVGRDGTIPFNSYHPFTEKPRKVLEKYRIGTFVDAPSIPKDTGFYRECSERVNQYFKSNGLDHKNPIPGLVRLIPLIFAIAGTYYVTFLSTANMETKLVFAITFGVLQALNTLHLMHDASHGAVGNCETWWWTVGRITLDWISGSSMLAWHNQHVVGHHAYTNVFGSDPDLPQRSSGDVRRLVPQQLWAKFYEWQVYYIPPLYGLLALRSRYYDIFEIFLCETNGPVKVNPISLQNQLRQSATKLFWLFWRVFLPLRYFGMDGSTLLVLFLVAEFTTGYWLAFNFQVSHISDVAEYYDEKSLLKEEWAILQVKTSVDYAHGSWLWTYLSGALNYQVVHHLFPGVSQYHYPKIAPIVMEVCKKHGLRYNVLPDFNEAISSHLRHLANMGAQHRRVSLSD